MLLKSSARCHGCRAPCPQALSFVRPPVRGTVLNAWVPRAEQCTCSILFHPSEVKTVKRDSRGNSSAACHELLDESPDHYLRYLRPRVFWRFQINSDARRCAANPQWWWCISHALLNQSRSWVIHMYSVTRNMAWFLNGTSLLDSAKFSHFLLKSPIISSSSSFLNSYLLYPFN